MVRSLAKVKTGSTTLLKLGFWITCFGHRFKKKLFWRTFGTPQSFLKYFVIPQTARRVRAEWLDHQSVGQSSAPSVSAWVSMLASLKMTSELIIAN